MARVTIHRHDDSEPEVHTGLKPSQAFEVFSKHRAAFFAAHPISRHRPTTNGGTKTDAFTAPNGDRLTIITESGEGL